METIQAPVPSLAQLVKSLAVSLGVATVLLATVILPAEYGIDPLGTGGLMGLDRLGAAAPTDTQDLVPAAATAADGSPVVPLTGGFQQDTRTLVLAAYEGLEMKAVMQSGDRFLFDWTTDGAGVYVDMHGERLNAKEEFTSYWKEKQLARASGAFTAPFAGTHGWYWQNMGDEPVTITLNISGFYEELHRPGG